MKRIITTTVALVMAVTCLSGCSVETSGFSIEETSTAEVTTTTTTEATTTTTTIEETTTTETTISRIVTVNSEELDALLAKQPIYVSKTKYLVQDKEYKALYPDMLQAIVTNNSEDDIKNAVVVFVAWDENNLPVKIRGEFDYSGDYLKGCNFSDINLVPGKSYGKDGGMSLDTGLNIKKFKAIVREYETFEGKKWTNPYYDAWVSMYGGGKKLKDDITVDCYLADEDYEELVKMMSEATSADNESDSSST